MRRLTVNADDFGFTRDVNEGIVTAHRDGILTATTLMANGAAFDHAIELARANPSLDIGCHLVLVGGQSLVDGRPYPSTVARLIRGLARREWDPERELAAQIERILSAGLRPTHLDSHKHTHLLPPVLAAAARLGERYGIRWIRRPFDFPLSIGRVPLGRRLVSASLGFLRPRFHDVLARHGMRSTDHFAGFGLTGDYSAGDLAALIASLPAGSTEFMCHPGYCGAELQTAPTRLKESRERELVALVDPAVQAALRREQVVLTRYGDL
jgi:predicted glycoside hydrolase/deacetylase ChbG (UPF0249 family)